MTLERVDIDSCNDPLQGHLHRVRYDFVLRHLTPGQSVLEIGTGVGTFSRELYPKCQTYVGVEYDAETCKRARERTSGRADIIKADARALPFSDHQFSFIVCLEVLEHLGNFAAGVTEIHRCLKPPGTVIISVPYRRIGGKSEVNEHHPYEPGEAELVSLLRGLFEVVEVYYQYFEESLFMTISRILHLRRFLGTQKIYADLAAGRSNALSRLKIGTAPEGMKVGLTIVAKGKRLLTS